MAYEPRLIAPFDNSNLKKWYKPWIIGATAFPQITDAYSRRGVVRKREGFRLFATLYNSTAINISAITPGSPTAITTSSPHGRTTGDIIVITGVTGTIATSINGIPFTITVTGLSTFTITLDSTGLTYTAGGLINLVDKPVQGLKNWVNPTTLGETLIAFSRTKSYRFNDVSQTFQDVTFLADGTTPFNWSNGTNDYFWASNFAGSMWVTNGTGTAGATDHIKYYNLSNFWTTIQPIVNGATTLDQALIILPYKGRLVVLNTVEGGNSFQSRARWSQLGTPYIANDATHKPAPGFGIDVNAWRDDIPGKGGFNDADTSERIVSAAIIKDTLIVGFQRSTWRLRYTGNEILPFTWERLNTQYGAEATFSNISFDEAALFFSRYGWIASDTNDVARIDLDIPDDSFAFEGTNINITGMNKVQGIRDFYRNFAYWTYIPIGQSIATQIYAYNYLDKSWTIFNPFSPAPGTISTNGINVFGNYRNTAGDFTWANLNSPGPNPPKDSWENYNSPDDTWADFGSGQNIDFPYIVGGDLLGNIYLMFEFFQTPVSDNGTPYNFSIFTKRFNPYLEKGMKCRLGYVDLYCSTNVGGEITVKHFVDDQQSPILTKTVEIFSRGVIAISNIAVGTTTLFTTVTDHQLTVGETFVVSDVIGTVGTILNNNTYIVASTPSTTTFTISLNTTGFIYVSNGFVYSDDLVQGDSKYYRIYLGATAHMHQLSFSLSDSQLNDPVKGVAQFEMQGLVTWTRAQGRIRG